ncbi:MAG: hypothetical protein PHH45_00690 [Patescibacteria group bacterium]|nr:hypothetical protein [Patescibacteria group bacterium]
MTILLISYIIFVIGFIAFSASGIYHLWRFGYIGDMTKPAIYIYIFMSASIIVLTFFAISFRSWF